MKQFMGFKYVGDANKTTHTIFGTNADPTAAAPATSPEMLATGFPGIYGKKGTGGYLGNNVVGEGELIALDAAGKFLDVKSFYIARGNAKGSNPLDTNDTAEGAILSDEIDRKTLTVEKYLYNAGAAKVITLGVLAGDNLIGGVPAPANKTAGVTIVDNSPTIMSDWKTRTYEVRPATGATAAAVATALAAKINADPNRLVDAAPATTTLVLTHRKKGVDFDAHGTDETLCENCTKVVTTKPVRVDNSIAAVRELELECHGYQGGTRRGDGQLGDILPYTQIEIDDPLGLIMYHLTWERQVNRQGVPVDAKASRFLRLYIAMPTGNTKMVTDFELLLQAALSEEIAGQGETPLFAQPESEGAKAKREEKEKEDLEKKKKELEKEAEKRAKEDEKAKAETKEIKR